MSCVNPNSPEFKKILEIEPNFLLAEIMYDKMMKDQTFKLYDDIFDLKEQSPIRKQKEIFGATENWGYKKPSQVAEISDKALRTLMNDPRYNQISDPELQTKFNELAIAIGEKEAWRDYFETKGVVRPSEVVMQKISDRITKEEMAQDFSLDEDSFNKPMPSIDEFINEFETVVDNENKIAALDAAERMSRQLNIPYEVITQKDMSEMFPGEPYRKAFYQGGKVYLVAGNLNASDVFHEFAHPIIKSMSKQNPELFQKLFDDLAATELGKQIISDLNLDPNLKPGTLPYMEEAIVMSLEAINQNENVAPQSFIKELFFQIKQFLRKVFGKKIDVSKLSSKTTLSDLVKMINYGEEFILDTKFLQKDMLVMFKTDYNQLKEQIQNSSREKAQQLINKFNDVVRLQLANFKAENDIYVKIQEGLADENREGLLNKAQKILENLATLGTRNLVDPLQTLNITGLDRDAILFDQKIKSFATVISTVDEVVELLNKKLDVLKSTGVKSDDEFDQLFAIMKYNEEWLDKIIQWRKEYISVDSAPFGMSLTFTDPTTGKTISANPLNDALREIQEKLEKGKGVAEKLQIDSVIDVLYDHLKDVTEPIKNDFLEQMQKAKDEGMISQYNRLHEQFYGLSPQDLVEFNRLKSRPFNSLSREEMIRFKNLQLRSFDSELISKEGLRATMEGRLGPAAKWHGLIESYMNNQDKVIGGFQSFLMKTYNTVNGNANARRAEMLDGLEPLLKAAGYDSTMWGEGQLGKDIGQRNLSYTTDSNGSTREFMEWRFMNNFYNWEYDRQIIQEKIKFARQKYNRQPDPTSRQEYEDAKAELEEFDTNYMHRDYVPEFYAVAKKWFSSPAGKQAKSALDDIFERMRAIAENAEIDPLKGGFNEATNEIWHEYQMLHNLFDFATGNEKTGIEKEIAEILSGYREEISEYFEWEEKENSFELALDLLHEKLTDEGLNPGDDAYIAAFQDFLEKNTTISVTADYHERREQLIEERSQLIQPILDINNSFMDIGPLHKQVYAILKPTKDNFNQYDGTMLTPDAQIKIRDIQQTIANLKEQWVSLSGYTKEEMRKYRAIEEFYLDNGVFEFDEDEDYYFNFWDDLADRLADLGISKDDVKRVREIDKELSSQKISGLTNYYITSLFSFYNTNDESKEIFDNAFKAYDLADGDIPTSKNIFDVIKDVYFVEKLMAVNPEFKTWFERNHYTEAADEFDPSDGTFIGEYTRYRPTAAWQFSMPENINDYETKSVIGTRIPIEFRQNGYIEIDGIPRIPTRAYYRRKVKENYRTIPIERDYVDTSGNLVLANIDNRGNWLPRDYKAGDPTSSLNDKYVDANYKAMFNNNRPLFELLDKLKNNHLDNQKGLDAPQKLYLSYPRFRQGEVEQYQKGYFKRKFNRFKETFTGAADDFELGINDNVFNRDSYKTLTRPISGNYALDINDVSTNIIDKMMDYSYSVEQFKTLRKVNSFAQSFENALINQFTNASASEVEKMIKDYELLNPGGKEAAMRDERIKAIKSILDKNFRGKNLTGLVTGTEDPSEGTKLIARLISKSQKRMSFMSFAFDIMKDLRNYLGGKSMMYKKAAEGFAYNGKDVAVTRGKSASVIAEIINHQYSKKQVSARLQLLDILDAIPGNLKKEIGRRGGKTFQQALFKGDVLYATRKYTSESVPVHQFLAILNHNSFMLNGKKTSLDDAVELINGKIQTVSGVPSELSITYDSDGRIKLGSKLQEIINIHQSMLQKSLGITNEYNEPEMYRGLAGKANMFLLKFFPGMFLDRYQIRTKKNRITGASKFGQRRINYNTRRAELGTYLAPIVLFQEIMSNKGRFYQWSKYSWQAKKGAIQLLLGYTISMIINMITGSIGFDDDGEEENDGINNFYWDPKEEGIFSKLKNSTSLPELPLISDERTVVGRNRNFNPENYLKLQVLRLMLLVKKEEETFMPSVVPSTLGEILTFQSPLQDGGAVKSIKDMSMILYRTYWEDDPQEYERAAGPFTFQEEGRNKFWNVFSKTFLGLNGSIVDPATTIQRENSDFFN